jgi:hypothetical protein
MGEGGGRTARMLRKMEEEGSPKPKKKAEGKSSVFVWPSGGAHGEQTGEDWDGSFSGTRKAQSSFNKKYPRGKEL